MEISARNFSRQKDQISRQVYYLVIALLLCGCFALTAMITQLTRQWEPNLISFLLIGLALPIAGIVLSARSDNSLVSFIGLLMVVTGMSAIVGPTLAYYEINTADGTIENAAYITASVSFIFGTMGIMFPKIFSKLGGALFSALIALLIVRIIALFIPALQEVRVISWFAAALFSLYIGYDMYLASQMSATWDNAVDSVVALYIDIINLFLNILELLASSDD